MAGNLSDLQVPGCSERLREDLGAGGAKASPKQQPAGRCQVANPVVVLFDGRRFDQLVVCWLFAVCFVVLVCISFVVWVGFVLFYSVLIWFAQWSFIVFFFIFVVLVCIVVLFCLVLVCVVLYCCGSLPCRFVAEEDLHIHGRRHVEFFLHWHMSSQARM